MDEDRRALEPTVDPVTDGEGVGPPAFDDFYRGEFHTVVALAYVLSGSRLAAEELAQESFLAAYRHWDRVSRYDRPDAWVRRVVTNKARSRLRRRTAEARALVRLHGLRRVLPETMAEPDQTFWRAVRSLPAMQARCIALRYLEDLPAREIARTLGCAEATVRVHLHRGRQTLATRLASSRDDHHRETR